MIRRTAVSGIEFFMGMPRSVKCREAGEDGKIDWKLKADVRFKVGGKFIRLIGSSWLAEGLRLM